MDALIVIPARVASSRLPGKVLADINGKPLIVRAYERSVAANVGDVIVACDGEQVKTVINKAGGIAVVTDPNLPSGTDRVYAAWRQFDPDRKYKYIINVQGDLPFIDEAFIQEAARIVRENSYDISTLATLISDDSYKLDSTVKPVIAFTSKNSGRALYFSRAIVPHNGPYYHHVGIYCFTAEALEKFVNLPQSRLETTEKLEQLRALENGMTIGITVIDKPSPISIDTPEDLKKALSYAEKFEK